MKKALNLFASILFALVICVFSFSCKPNSTLQSPETLSKDESLESEEESVAPTLDDIVDFIVEVPEGRDPVILQFADPQLIDSSQMRTQDRLGLELVNYWSKDSKEDRCFKYMRQVIETVNPDFIMITGDIVYGEFDDDGSNLIAFIEFMEGFGISWSPIFGNHENESTMGVDWQCEQFENATNCLFKRGKITGNGNYTVAIKQGDNLLRVFYMLDSNGCSNPSEKTLECERFKSSLGFDREQRDWYKDSIKSLKEVYPNVKLSFSFHIPIYSFVFSAQLKYGYDKANFSPINVDEIGEQGDFGYIGSTFSGWDNTNTIWENLKSLGVDSIFVGHEHAINSSIVYDGVRLQFGQKCSTYDQANYLTSNGEIEYSYTNRGTPLVGGTVITLDKDNGDIENAYVKLYEEGL